MHGKRSCPSGDRLGNQDGQIDGSLTFNMLLRLSSYFFGLVYQAAT
jgi:hypothetical protein